MSGAPEGTVSVAEILAYLNDDGYIGMDAAARYVGLSKRTFSKHVKDMQPRPFKCGRKLLFKKSELDAWMENHRLPNVGELFEDSVEDTLRMVIT